MKRAENVTYGNLLIRLALCVFVLGPFACRQELEDRYSNPDRTDDATINQFFTAMLNNNRVRPAYWEMSTFVNWHIGVYTQSVGFLNSESVYQQNESYISDRWDDFYRPGVNGAGVMALFREIERLYKALPGDGKQEAEIFYQAARVVFYDQAAQMVDLWGDIPFSEAGALNLTSEVVYPAFDDQQDIYNTILEGLAETSGYFASAAPSTTTQNLFSIHDILLSGRLDGWRRYINSLRLRLFMRISRFDEERAREEVQKILLDPVLYPLTGDVEDYDPRLDDILLQPLTDNTVDLRAAFTDWTNYPAPYHMLEAVLKPAGDPRIPVLFDKYGKVENAVFVPNTVYSGMPLTLSRIEQLKNLGSNAIIDSSTFLYSIKLPGVVMTAAEVSFLKAEAFERWGGGDALQAYQAGIRQSIDFYYYLNSLNNAPKAPLKAPTDTEKNDFVNNSAFIRYTGSTEEKLALIATQKWVHFGFLQAAQSWAELRRTNYPALAFHPASLAGYELPPSRLTYPINEKSFNLHYQDVAATDVRDARIFWDVD